MDHLFYEYVCFHEVILKLLAVKSAAVDRSQHLKLKTGTSILIHKELCVLVCFLLLFALHIWEINVL